MKAYLVKKFVDHRIQILKSVIALTVYVTASHTKITHGSLFQERLKHDLGFCRVQRRTVKKGVVVDSKTNFNHGQITPMWSN